MCTRCGQLASAMAQEVAELGSSPPELVMEVDGMALKEYPFSEDLPRLFLSV